MTRAGARPKILVADEHRPARMAMRRVLAGVDADVVDATNGNDVLAASLEHEFALILLDVQMPDVDGVDAATLLAGEERSRSTPIIFVTASHADDANRLRGRTFATVDYVTKPINEVVVLSKVRVFVEMYRNRVALGGALSELGERNRQLEREIAERRTAEEQVRHLTHHDGLTGLANRVLFLSRLDAAIARSRADCSGFALAFLDIDGFGRVNDQHGQAAGDDLLRIVARRLGKDLRYNETAARTGSDEFAVILDVDDARAAGERAFAMARHVFQPRASESRIGAAGIEISVRGNIGIALHPRHGDDSESMIHAATIALHTARRERSPLHVLESSSR